MLSKLAEVFSALAGSRKYPSYAAHFASADSD
jgi:hypothetical protein